MGCNEIPQVSLVFNASSDVELAFGTRLSKTKPLEQYERMIMSIYRPALKQSFSLLQLLPWSGSLTYKKIDFYSTIFAKTNKCKLTALLSI